jgi:cbb3-type cytochrome oxidase subunit 3
MLDYETIRSYSSLGGLILFVTLFALVLLYVFWPSNSKNFEEASRIPFENENSSSGGSDGR